MTTRNDIEKEASELGFAPNLWPLDVTVDGKVFTFSFTEFDGDGEIEAVVYKAADGSRLFVLND